MYKFLKRKPTSSFIKRWMFKKWLTYTSLNYIINIYTASQPLTHTPITHTYHTHTRTHIFLCQSICVCMNHHIIFICFSFPKLCLAITDFHLPIKIYCKFMSSTDWHAFQIRTCNLVTGGWRDFTQLEF